MGGSAGGSMGHAMSNMTGLAACNVSDTKPMQFPLTQRRKRRVLFTQAQVSIIDIFYAVAYRLTLIEMIIMMMRLVFMSRAQHLSILL